MSGSIPGEARLAPTTRSGRVIRQRTDPPRYLAENPPLQTALILQPFDKLLFGTCCSKSAVRLGLTTEPDYYPDNNGYYNIRKVFCVSYITNYDTQ